MGCATWGVTQVMVGLHRVGLVGLGRALGRVEQLGLDDREAILDRIIDDLRPDNFLPESQMAELRRAIWREVLRERGEDFSRFYSRVEVTVAGEAGPARERFADEVRRVFASFELEPQVTFAPAPEQGPHLQLCVGEHTIVSGHPPRRELEAALRTSFSEW